jgi:hypothetical protein
MDTVMGALRTSEMADRVVGILLEGGFEAKDMSVLGCAAAEASPASDDVSATNASLMMTGAVATATSGAFGALALGRDPEVLTVPDAGPVRVVGALAAELFAAVNSGKAGGLAAFFVDHGVPEATATLYAEAVRGGGYVVVVHTDGGDHGERAEAILAAQGADAPVRRHLGPPSNDEIVTP